MSSSCCWTPQKKQTNKPKCLKHSLKVLKRADKRIGSSFLENSRKGHREGKNDTMVTEGSISELRCWGVWMAPLSNYNDDDINMTSAGWDNVSVLFILLGGKRGASATFIWTPSKCCIRLSERVQRLLLLFLAGIPRLNTKGRHLAQTG